jgi:hypothetical protein
MKTFDVSRKAVGFPHCAAAKPPDTIQPSQIKKRGRLKIESAASHLTLCS